MSEMHDLAAFYAIGALEGGERTAFEMHLDDCAACRAEVAELSPGVEMLTLAVAEPAPEELRGRVDAAVDRIAGPNPVALEASVIPIGSTAALWRVAAGVAAAAALVFAVAYTSTAGDARFGSDVAAVLAATDATVVQVAGTDVGNARFVYSNELGRGVFSGSSIPSLAGGRTYQLWLIDEDGPSSLGLFAPDDDGGSAVVVEGDVRRGAVLGVTNEPEGGSDQPTGPVLLAVDL